MTWVRSRRRKSGIYYYVRTRTGQELAAGRNKDVAKRIAAKMDDIERLEKFGIVDPSLSDWTMKTLVAWDHERNPEPTRARRWAVLVDFFGEEKLIDEITAADLYAYTSKRRKTAKPATVNRDLSLLSGALRAARKDPASGYSRDPFAAYDFLDERASRRPSVALGPAQVRRLISIAWALWPPGGAIVELLALTGSRLQQVLDLRRDQIRRGRLTFPAQKGGLERTFELTPRLRRIVSRVPRRQERLFDGVRADGSGTSFRRFWRRLTRATGIQIRPHDLRHTAATQLYRRGATVDEVQRLLGHKSPEMAMRLYTHLHPSVMKPVTYGSHVRATRGAVNRTQRHPPRAVVSG